MVAKRPRFDQPTTVPDGIVQERSPVAVYACTTGAGPASTVSSRPSGDHAGP
jgi:hypothetical protein